ncbi:hypothetical protein [Streptomyces prunicolor]|uniref:hypothetical protein n=1 Tax=Streptomyces prunicolor TaxID=67348 RepID=UPI0033C1E72F
MNEDQATGWAEGTSADLVADALALGVKASARMVTAWVEEGLLASPEPRKTSAHGSDPRVFPPLQRKLFTKLLEVRERSPLGRIPQRALIRLVLHMWLADDTVVLTPQARRAWRTHARSFGQVTATKRSEGARAVVEQLAHPSASFKQRRAAQLVLEEDERTQQIDLHRLTSVLTELCSPWPTQPGSPRIERALPTPFGPLTVQQVIAMWKATQQTIRRLRHEEIDETALDRARAVHRQTWAEYQVHRSAALAAGAGAFTSTIAVPDTVEGQVIEQVIAFVGTLAGELGLIEAASHEVEAVRLRRTR